MIFATVLSPNFNFLFIALKLLKGTYFFMLLQLFKFILYKIVLLKNFQEIALVMSKILSYSQEVTFMIIFAFLNCDCLIGSEADTRCNRKTRIFVIIMVCNENIIFPITNRRIYPFSWTRIKGCRNARFTSTGLISKYSKQL